MAIGNAGRNNYGRLDRSGCVFGGIVAHILRLIFVPCFLLLFFSSSVRADCLSDGICATESAASSACSTRYSTVMVNGVHGVAPYPSCTRLLSDPPVSYAGHVLEGHYEFEASNGQSFYWWWDKPPACSATAPELSVSAGGWAQFAHKMDNGNYGVIDSGCCFSTSQADAVQVVGQYNGGIYMVSSNHWKPTGTNACTGGESPTISAPTPSPFCATDTTGAKTCVYPDGGKCVTTASGFTACWTPTQSGPVSSATRTEAASSGINSVPIPPAPRTGETFTSTSSSTVISSNTSTTINVFTNPTTGSATPVPGDGSTGPVQGTGSTATGGTCGAPYSCTSLNGVECAQLEEQRLTRCGTTASNTILGSIVAGETANGTKLDAANSSLTAIKNVLNGTTTGTPDVGGSDGGTASGHGFGGNTEYGASGLDASGLGFSQTCPTIPDVSILGHTLHFDTSIFCTWMTLSGKLLLIACAISSLLIIVRN